MPGPESSDPEAMKEWARGIYLAALYSAKYDYLYDTDPRLRTLMERTKREEIRKNVEVTGEDNLSLKEKEEYDLLKRYEKSKFTKQWFQTNLGYLREMGRSGYFTPSETISDMNEYIFQQAGDLLILVKPYFTKKETIKEGPKKGEKILSKRRLPKKFVLKAEQLLDLALANLFPGLSQQEIAKKLKLKPKDVRRST